MKKIMILLILTIAMFFPYKANAEERNGLITDSNGNRYYYVNGIKQNGFQTIEGKTYFFSRINNNEMRTGMFRIDGRMYYFDEEGVMQTGWYQNGREKWYFDKTGQRVSGFQTIEGKTYFFSRINNNEMRTGMFRIDGPMYYFDEEGVMQIGYQEMEDGNRYFSELGHMQTGIVEINGNRYYFDDNGIKSWGFQAIEGQTYFFSRINDHEMRTGFIQIDNDFYYFTEEGVMQTGFQKIDGIQRFFSRIDGHMRTGWILIDKNMYYFNPENGEMTTGEKTIDNVNYIFKEDGKLKDGFVTDTSGNERYYFPDGTYANDWTTITGTKYFFNSLGVMIGKNVKKIIDVSSYQGVIDWDRVVNEGNVDGVILRIAAGCDKEDSMLARNISEVKRLGLPYGIYIYSYAENYYEGTLYANFTMSMIKKYELNPILGIYFDLESNGITGYLKTAEYEQITRGYMDTMNNNGYGDITKIYTYKNYADEVLNSNYLKNLITWIAQYNHYCTYNGNYIGWQYSSTEKIPGISGNVDVNVFWI